MTRPLLLLALAAVLGFLWGLWRRECGHDWELSRGSGTWECLRCKVILTRPEDSDGIAPPDPWTVGLLS